jgi:hypothetical protein
MSAIDLDPMLALELQELTPFDEAAVGDWRDVERRAGGAHGRRRALLLAATVGATLVALLATPLGGAVARGVEDFSAWLTGAAGQPVSEGEQQAFDVASARAWSAFPPGTTLRRLLAKRVDGVDYTVLGLRAGDDVCVRVEASGETMPSSFGCVPVSALRSAAAPVLVVRADQPVWPAGETHGASRDLASVTFGIAADGVDAVELGTDEESTRVDVVDNTFVYVASRPRRGTRVRNAEAILAGGGRVDVQFASAPYGTWDLPPAPGGKPLGPDRVDRSVPVGTVGWILRHEPRGEEPPRDMVERATAGMPGKVVLARLIHIDRAGGFATLVAELQVDRRNPGNYRVGGRMVCFTLVSHGQLLGGGCNAQATLLYDGPFTLGESIAEGGDQYAVLYGIANDQVARMTLYQANGDVVSVPLRDNVYAVRALRAAYPVRLVAADAAGRVIGIKTFASDLPRVNRPRPVPGADWRKLTTTNDAQGRESSLWVAPAVGGGTCYKLRTPSGATQSGCRPRPYTGSTLAVGVTGLDVSRPVLVGIVGDAVTRVTVRYPDGSETTLRPAEGYVLGALDPTRTEDGEALLVRALDAGGIAIGQARLELRR